MNFRVFTVWAILAAGLFAERAPKNIILMIGDGMGVSHVTAGKIVQGDLNMERLETGGLMTTFSANALVTDSAAAGTALATGCRTDNGVLSMTPDGTALKTVGEFAKERGKAVGMAVTSSLTQATPAAFVSHVPSRSMDEEIARQIVDSGFDVLFGGGLAWFVLVPENKTQTELDKRRPAMGKTYPLSGSGPTN